MSSAIQPDLCLGAVRGPGRKHLPIVDLDVVVSLADAAGNGAHVSDEKLVNRVPEPRILVAAGAVRPESVRTVIVKVLERPEHVEHGPRRCRVRCGAQLQRRSGRPVHVVRAVHTTGIDTVAAIGTQHGKALEEIGLELHQSQCEKGPGGMSGRIDSVLVDNVVRPEMGHDRVDVDQVFVFPAHVVDVRKADSPPSLRLFCVIRVSSFRIFDDGSGSTFKVPPLSLSSTSPLYPWKSKHGSWDRRVRRKVDLRLSRVAIYRHAADVDDPRGPRAETKPERQPTRTNAALTRITVA